MKIYLKEFQFLKSYYIILPFIITGCYTFFHFANPETVILFGKEDSPVEWLSFICLSGAAIFYCLSFKKYKNYFFLLLGLLMFFGAAEEISWGQRIFGFSTPETVKKLNVQGEFTIHNLEIFASKQFDHVKRTGLYRLLEIDLWFKIFIFSFGIILPIATYHLRSVAVFTQKIKLPIPPVSIGIFFLITWLVRGLAFYYIPLPENGYTRQFGMLRFVATETYEFIAALILFIISLYFYNMKFRDFIGKDIKQFLGHV